MNEKNRKDHNSPVKKYKELIKSQKQWEDIFDTIPDFVLVMDDKHRIVKANKAIVEKLGVKKENLLGKQCFEVIHGTQAPPSFCPHFKTMKSGREHIEEIYDKRFDGYFLHSASPCHDDDGNIIGVVEILRDITARKKMEEKLHETSITDDLTGLLNRRGFFTFSEKQFEISRRNRRNFAILFLDLNNMKSINDQFGHQAGDQALIDTANILKKTFRSSDILARLGGDEFIVLMTETRSRNFINVVTRNIKKNLTSHNKSSESGHALSISMGTALFDPDKHQSLDELMQAADELMYEAKKYHQEGMELTLPPEDEDKEKRNYERYESRNGFITELIVSDDLRLRNISTGGLCLQTSRQLVTQSHYRIKLISKSETITPEGIVMWTSPAENAAPKEETPLDYEAGLKFINLDKGMKASIKNFIDDIQP